MQKYVKKLQGESVNEGNVEDVLKKYVKNPYGIGAERVNDEGKFYSLLFGDSHSREETIKKLRSKGILAKKMRKMMQPKGVMFRYELVLHKESINEADGDLNDLGYKKIKAGFKYLDNVVKKLQAAVKKEDSEETIKSIKGLNDIAGIMYDMIGVGRFYESINEAVVATMRTRSGTRTLEKKGGKLTMKMPNGEVLKFKDGADVKEYMDRVYGYWSFIKGYGKVKGLREVKTDPKAAVGVRTDKGPIDIFIEKGKPVIYARNDRLEFKNGKDVREYLDRIYGHWSFFKGKDNNPIKGLRESTAAYEKALQKIAKDKQLSMLSKKDRETLLKVAQLMKSANENKKMNEKVAMPLGDHLSAATKELDYMIKVGPIEDAYDSPKVSLKAIKMARKLLDKVN